MVRLWIEIAYTGQRITGSDNGLTPRIAGFSGSSRIWRDELPNWLEDRLAMGETITILSVTVISKKQV